jgi:hypothetical protein
MNSYLLRPWAKIVLLILNLPLIIPASTLSISLYQKYLFSNDGSRLDKVGQIIWITAFIIADFFVFMSYIKLTRKKSIIDYFLCGFNFMAIASATALSVLLYSAYININTKDFLQGMIGRVDNGLTISLIIFFVSSIIGGLIALVFFRNKQIISQVQFKK